MNNRAIVTIAYTLVLALVPVALAQEPSPASAQRIEAVGKITPAGVAQAHEKDIARAQALRKIALTVLERKAPGVPAQRLCKAALDKLDLPTLQAFFTSQDTVYEKTRSGYYEVKVGAVPKTDKIESWAEPFLKDPPIKKLRIMIVIPEQHLQRPIPDPAGETEMTNRFVKEGFRVVDRAQVQTIRDKDMVKRAMKNDPKELLAIAQTWGAELLLIGEAFSQDATPIAAAAACRARIEARIIMCDTGDILAAGDAEAGAQDASPAVAAKAALRNAATILFEKLVTDILVQNTGAQARSRVRVVLAGADFEQKLTFKGVLEGLKEIVSETEEVSYLEARAEFDVVTAASSAKLAEVVFLAAKKQGLSLKVVEQSSRRCVFEMRMAERTGQN